MMNDLIIQQPKNTRSDCPLVIFIMGPTASGKTELAVQCVEQMNCELISVDSALVYREMNIGTAKPDAETLRRAPHKLIDIINPNESYSAANFRQDALIEINSIIARGKTPVLVGGTMLYYKSLQEGLSQLPAANEIIRIQLNADIKRLGIQVMHARLEKIDPVSAQRINPNDQQRIQRALEVYEVSGKTLTDFWLQQSSQTLPYKVIKIAFFPDDRESLKKRIAIRFYKMLKMGFVNEVENLKIRKDLNLNLPSMRCVGYRQVWEYLDGLYTEDEMTEKAIIATRQLAKRQLTWLRKEENCNFYDIDPSIYLKVLKKINYLL